MFYNTKKVSFHFNKPAQVLTVPMFFKAYCETKASLEEICDGITGDAPLYSMFRKYPEAGTIPCPFKSAPFSFIYNKGTGDCKEPLSRAESCTDDSRLVLKYQACTDVPSTESNGVPILHFNPIFFCYSLFYSRRISLSGNVERRLNSLPHG